MKNIYLTFIFLVFSSPLVAQIGPVNGNSGECASITGSPSNGTVPTATSSANPPPCSWQTPSGSGTVTTTGSPTSGQISKFSGSSSITNATGDTDYAAAPGAATVPNALVAGTYTSGITTTGTTTQTCILTFTGGATATVALTGTNTIAGGTALVITAAGANNTVPTTAPATAGTAAACSGTATVAITSVSTAYGSATGVNQFNLTLGANVTAATCPTNLTADKNYTFHYIQNATGGYTITYPSCFPTLVPVAGEASATTDYFMWWDGSAFHVLSGANSSGHSICAVTTAPANPPASGDIYTWCDSTSGKNRIMTQDSSGNNTGTVADIAATSGQAVTQIVGGVPAKAALTTTPNGQACATGSTCNVNVGAATHSVALNEGNGSAITGLALGAHQTAIGAAGADPNAKTIPDCTDTGGNHLNFTQSSDAFSCGNSGGGGGGGAALNPACTFSATATGCTITVSGLTVPNADYTSIIVNCWTGASTTQTILPILTYVYAAGATYIATVAPTFSSAPAAGYCTANLTSGGVNSVNAATGTVTYVPTASNGVSVSGATGNTPAFSSILTKNAQSGTTYSTVNSTDCGNVILLTGSANQLVTLTTSGTPTGCPITISNVGVISQATPASGSILWNTSNLTYFTIPMGDQATFVFDGTNWVVTSWSGAHVLCDSPYDPGGANTVNIISAPATGTAFFGGSNTSGTQSNNTLQPFSSAVQCALPANMIGANTLIRLDTWDWTIGSGGPNLIFGITLGTSAGAANSNLTSITPTATFNQANTSEVVTFYITGQAAPGASALVDGNCQSRSLAANLVCLQATFPPTNTYATNTALTIFPQLKWSANTAGNAWWLKRATYFLERQ